MHMTNSNQNNTQIDINLRKPISIKRRSKIFTREHIILYLMFLPVIAYYLIFCYPPMSGIAIAFADYRISGFKKWVGFENSEYLFNLKYFWDYFKTPGCT